MLFFSSYFLHNILFKWEKWTPQILIIWVKNNQNIFWCSSPSSQWFFHLHNSPLFSNLSCLFPSILDSEHVGGYELLSFLLTLATESGWHGTHKWRLNNTNTPISVPWSTRVFPFDDPSSSSSGCGSVLHYPHFGKEPCECSIRCLQSPFQIEELR